VDIEDGSSHVLPGDLFFTDLWKVRSSLQ
jgi:hypothetical protein